ncbi:dihydrodipicolinate synthase family protein [Nocardia sputorum]|uniref:dihydrodipicolinate synthase family protein n=1 Tax=Nocardia sputorum TaxID=2984338 RepID=UPI002490A659|nr:dihydrodipicolinate synthase family protein [Nocardia sputorum]
MASSVIVAVVTPFRASGSIDFGALSDYLELLSTAGVDTILVNGTTGEFASLTFGERRAVIEHCRRAWTGTLIAHVGATAAGEVIEAARHAEEYADMLAVISPFFFAAAPEAGIEQFFGQVLAESVKPWLLYNFPRHTGNPLTASMVARLAEKFPQLHGVKDSGKDPALTRQYKACCPRLSVYVGDDRVPARLNELGVDGVVTGAGGPVAELPVAITAAADRGEVECARSRQQVFDDYSDTRKAMALSDIGFAKAAVGARLPGFPPHVRAPLVAADKQQLHHIRRYMHASAIPAIQGLRRSM